MESVWSVSKLSTESVGSRRELVANSVHIVADADDATQLDSCVASASVVGFREKGKGGGEGKGREGSGAS